MKAFAAALLLALASAAEMSTMELKFMNHCAKFGKNIAGTEEF